MSPHYQDYYKELGVSRTASQEEIQKAYRALAKKYHPDINKDPGAEDHFKRINEAHDVLKDPEKRKLYDSLGPNWKAGQDFRPPPGFENMRFHFGGKGQGSRGGFHQGGGGFSDFFESLFGGGGGNPFQQGGAGGFHPGGGGFRAESFNQGSPFGGGFGGAESFQDPFGGFGQQSHTAAQTDQEAELTVTVEDLYHSTTKTIRLSSGAGETKTLQVKIPAGSKDGTKIRLAGQGGSQGMGRVGDLLLTLRLAQDHRYRVEGHNLTAVLPVTPWEAALGAKVQVTTMAGEIALNLPAGTQSGKQLRLRGKGLPKSKAERGDLRFTVEIRVPENLSDEERELFERLAQGSTFNPRG